MTRRHAEFREVGVGELAAVLSQTANTNTHLNGYG